MSPDAASPNTASTPERSANGAAVCHPRRHWALWVAIICMLLGAGYLLSQRSSSPQTKGKKGKGAGGGAIPVSVSPVKQGNIGVYVNALGTVTPVYSVTVTSRVTGQLLNVYYHEGQMVHKGQLLAEIDPRPYQATYMQAQGQLERDTALLNNAKTDLERYQMAYAQHAIPEQTVTTQQSAINQDLGTVKVDEGNLAAAKVNLDYAKITAPIDGRVGLRTVDPGNIVPANGTTGLLSITQLQPITVIFNMAEDYISEVATQLRAGHKLRVDALDRDNATDLAQGTLLTLDNQIDTTTGTVRVRASFANRDFKLFPNEFVNARLLVRTLNNVNLIPTAAIQRNNDIAFVYVVDPTAKTVRSRDIVIATTNGDAAAVTGVKPGETLVTDGFDKLEEGTKVSIRKPAGSASAPPNTEETQPQSSQSAADSQPNAQGASATQLNGNQENPQQPQTSHPHTGRHK
jgi:multidrug efflux system membrane fusion protein